MKTEIKTRWLEALRSGEYEQGRKVLRTADDKFCCLGVLCELAVADGAITSRTVKEGLGDGEVSLWWYEGEMVDGSAVWMNSSTTTLPAKAVEWAGLDKTNPGVEIDGETLSLAGLNDEGRTFDEIADLIEEQL